MNNQHIVYGLLIAGIAVLALIILDGFILNVAASCEAIPFLQPCPNTFDIARMLCYGLIAIGALDFLYGLVSTEKQHIEVVAVSEKGEPGAKGEKGERSAAGEEGAIGGKGAKAGRAETGARGERGAVVAAASGPESRKACLSCGEPNAGNAIFCTKCGARLGAEPKAKCPYCNAENLASASFCITCGSFIGKRKPAPTTTADGKHLCPKCKAENEPGAEKCAKCGEVLGERRRAFFIQCHGCGVENSKDADICRRCGTKLK